MSWEKVELGEVTESCLGKMLDKNKNRGEYQPYLANLNVRWGEFDLENLNQMKFEERESERYGIRYGDLIICEGGEPGRCAIWKEQIPNMKIQKALHRVRVHECLDYRYLYYWFLLAGRTGELGQYFTGATIKHMPGDKLKTIKIDMPPIEIQRRFADILSAYDNLIENNQKQISLLEEAAQRLYKEWFVDLHFPGYEDTKIIDGVPEGWKKGRADEFFNITIGKTPPRSESEWFTNMYKGIPWVSIADMGKTTSHIFETKEGLTKEAVKRHNVKVVPSGTILLSFKLTVGRVTITTTDMCTNEAIAHFYMPKDYLRAYTYYYLNNFHYDELGSTSSISKAVNSKFIKAMPFVMPTQDIAESFSKVVVPIFEQVKNKEKSIINAIESRDRLLPKLMSGELEI